MKFCSTIYYFNFVSLITKGETKNIGATEQFMYSSQKQYSYTYKYKYLCNFKKKFKYFKKMFIYLKNCSWNLKKCHRF